MKTNIKVLNDRGKCGRTVRDWTWGIGNEAEERQVMQMRGTYAATKRAALARAEECGYTVVECYKDAAS